MAAKNWQYKGVSRAERLLRLVQVLRRYRQPVGALALADELEVSIRSVYRDVQTLRAQGATIEGEPGVGYVLRPGFLLPPLMFSDDELEALVLGLRLTVEHADDALGRAASDVVAKLRAVLPKDLRAVVDETALLAGPALLRRQRPYQAPDFGGTVPFRRRIVGEGMRQHSEVAGTTGFVLRVRQLEGHQSGEPQPDTPPQGFAGVVLPQRGLPGVKVLG